MTLFQMVDALMWRSNRWMTERDVRGGLRAMFAVKVGRAELRRFFYSEQIAFQHHKGHYRLNDEARLERLVSELMAA